MVLNENLFEEVEDFEKYQTSIVFSDGHEDLQEFDNEKSAINYINNFKDNKDQDPGMYVTHAEVRKYNDSWDDFDVIHNLDENLNEDTIKQGNKWVNKGKEGTHGSFKTKKEADAQRKAMFAQGYKESLTKSIDPSILDKAYNGSYYTIIGAGGDIEEWKKGYQDLLDKENIGTIKEWITFKGSDMNNKYELIGNNAYPNDLTFLAFPLDSLNVTKLGIFKSKMGDSWFDDIVDNNAGKEDLDESLDEEIEDISDIVFNYNGEDGIDVAEKSEIDHYFTIVKNVNEAERFNYHSDYWGQAEGYQEENVELMRRLQPYVGKKVKIYFDDATIQGTLIGLAIDRQYNDLSHSKIVLDNIEELEENLKNVNESLDTYIGPKRVKDLKIGDKLSFRSGVAEIFQIENHNDSITIYYTRDGKEGWHDYNPQEYVAVVNEDITESLKKESVDPVAKEDGPKTKDTGIAQFLIDAINGEWNTIKLYNDIMVNLESYGYSEIADIIRDINNEENIHVGQLQKALETISPNANSINDGEAEAEKQLTDTTEVNDLQNYELSEGLTDAEFEKAQKEASEKARKETIKKMIKDRETGSLADRIEASELEKELNESNNFIKSEYGDNYRDTPEYKNSKEELFKKYPVLNAKEGQEIRNKKTGEIEGKVIEVFETGGNILSFALDVKTPRSGWSEVIWPNELDNYEIV